MSAALRERHVHRLTLPKYTKPLTLFWRPDEGGGQYVASVYHLETSYRRSQGERPGPRTPLFRRACNAPKGTLVDLTPKEDALFRRMVEQEQGGKGQGRPPGPARGILLQDLLISARAMRADKKGRKSVVKALEQFDPFSLAGIKIRILVCSLDAGACKVPLSRAVLC